MQQCFRLGQSLRVTRVNHKDDGVNFIEVVLPEACGLPTDVPQRKVIILVLDLLDVEAYSRHSLLELTVAHLEQQSRLASVV